MRKAAFFAFLAMICFSTSCKKDATHEATQTPAIEKQACKSVIEVLGEKWQCREAATMDFVLVPPEKWPDSEKERRSRILETAGLVRPSFADRSFGLSVEFAQEKVKAEYLIENRRAFSEYSAFGLTYKDIEEFEIVEEEQRLELEESGGENRLRHYVRVRNRLTDSILNLKVRSCLAFEKREKCTESVPVEELPPNTAHFWSLDLGPMNAPDVRAWYELTAADGRRIMAYQPNPNDLYKAWVGMLNLKSYYFTAWNSDGDDPQRMIRSKWTASEKLTALNAAEQKAEAEKLYRVVQSTLQAFFAPEELEKEMNIAVGDANKRLLLNYGSEAVN